MKKLQYFILILGVLFVASCNDLRDTYSDYLGDGERAYVGKLSEVELLPGLNRMVVKGSMQYMKTAVKCRIALEGTEIVQDVDVDLSAEMFECEITNIPAGNYYVTITNFDKDKNASVPETYNIDVYDASRAEDFYPKRITGASFTPMVGTMKVTMNTVEDASSVLVKYKNEQGEDCEMVIDAAATEFSLTNWADESEIQVITRVLPSEDALDEIALEPAKYTLPAVPETMEVPRNYFAMTNTPSDVIQGQYGGPTYRMWDGATWWGNEGYHSNDGQGIPHHITFDMGLTAALSQCRVHFRGDGGWTDWPPRRLQIWGFKHITEEGKGINDYDVIDTPTTVNEDYVQEATEKGWILLADVEFTEEDLRVNCSKTFDLERIEGIRYIRYRIVEGWKAPHTGPGMYGSATEIYFWGLSKKIIALPE